GGAFDKGMTFRQFGFMMPDGRIIEVPPGMTSTLTERVMQTLYPQIKPYARHDLAVDEPHVLYVDESGSPEGLPVGFIHGGPGAGCDAQSRRYFDPNLSRLGAFPPPGGGAFDQRGCGRSTPHASLENNTTWDLVADLERIREHLGIDKWVLFGGSWG